VPLQASAFVVLALLGLPATPARADDDSEAVMTTDRPDFGESSEVVGKGRFQIETGLQSERSSGGGLKFNTSTTPTLLRLGIAPTWELRAETDGLTRLRTDDSATGTTTTVRGFSDTALGVKWHMQDGDDDTAQPSLAWILNFEFDSGSAAFRGNGVRPSLRAPMEWELAQGFSIGMMPGVAVETNAAGQRFVSGIFELSVEKAWTDAFHSFIEFAAQQVTTATNGGSVLTFDLGASYLVTRTLQLDLSVYRGLNHFSPDWVWNAGLSVKF
jgi:hypothetical protein